MRVALAQADFLVGALDANTERVIEMLVAARDQHQADVIVFPELALSGYPPEDLLLRPSFIPAVMACLERVMAQVQGIDVVIGHPSLEAGRRYNSVSWLRQGQRLGVYHKHLLPNYAVFDEKRYFEPGQGALIVDCKGVKCGVLICEDSWQAEPAQAAARAGAELLIVPNASPFHVDKGAQRHRTITARARESGCGVAYVNLVGGQDELVFDGRSFLVDANGQATPVARAFDCSLLVADFQPSDRSWLVCQWPVESDDENGLVYRALVCATRDYVHNNGFSSIILGLSGGIDSALTLAVAVDAFGASNCTAVMLPSKFTSELSLRLARQQCQISGVELIDMPIESSVQALLSALQPQFEGLDEDLTEENVQARCRGLLLMALSNKFGHLLLTTGNKSEYAVGYATIYGDMCGAYAPLKDCVKTRVYALAEHRNLNAVIIPEQVISRPPSAELRHDQTDQDSLPPYEVLDEIIRRYVEQDQSVEQLVNAGFDRAEVARIVRLIHINEYKRRQSAPGARITPRGFGRDRRYPMTSGWRHA